MKALLVWRLPGQAETWPPAAGQAQFSFRLDAHSETTFSMPGPDFLQIQFDFCSFGYSAGDLWFLREDCGRTCALRLSVSSSKIKKGSLYYAVLVFTQSTTMYYEVLV